MEIKKHMELLGKKVRDRVTGFQGVASCVSFDLYGCIQAVVSPAAEKNNLGDSKWFDVNRLEVRSDKPVMEVPNFDFGPVAQGLKGPAEKPANGRF